MFLEIAFWTFAVIAAVSLASLAVIAYLIVNAPVVHFEKPERPTEREPPEFGTKWEAKP